MADMVTAVEELLFNAELMAFLPQDSGISETRMVVFRAMASQLYTEALNIQQLTKNYNQTLYEYDLLDMAFHRLNATFQACHEMFRSDFGIGKR